MEGTEALPWVPAATHHTPAAQIWARGLVMSTQRHGTNPLPLHAGSREELVFTSCAPSLYGSPPSVLKTRVKAAGYPPGPRWFGCSTASPVPLEAAALIPTALPRRGPPGRCLSRDRTAGKNNQGFIDLKIHQP